MTLEVVSSESCDYVNVAQPKAFHSSRRDASCAYSAHKYERADRSFGLYTSKAPRKAIYAAVESESSLSSANTGSNDYPPPGCTRMKVELSKPLGMILEEDKSGNIFVAEVLKGGNADKSGLIDVGDQLIATSAIVYGSEDYYQGVRVRKGMQVVRLSVFGEKFDTVMAAIGTHPAHMKVTLEIQKCARPTSTDENNGVAN
ncbi:hypothetical protein KP509_24G075800 [Ceratopteris richardii]|uniref:PDZ domain-containing protein n=1 Tax=Ceratopteris richardii TaxID=49495 RepID=A0A8T2RXY3_CERRI|nr:hypothetical protein KP509_24G075800 [Ceratopteris richardii]